MQLDDVNYLKYKELKSSLKYSKDGIDFNKVVSINILLTIYGLETISYSGIVRQFFKRLEIKKLKEAFLSYDSVITSGSFDNRKDCIDQIELTLLNLTNSTYISLNNLKNILVFNPFRAIKFIAFVFSRLRKLANVKEKLFFASCLCYYENTYQFMLKDFREVDLSGKKYVAFHSSFGIEALTTQYFNQIGLNTYSLSHGLSYINYKKFIPVDIIGGENVTAGKVIVWGESSKSDLNRNFDFDNNRIEVGGNLKYPFKHIKIKKEFKNGLIMLGRAIYHLGNIQILKIANEISAIAGIKFSVRLHPSLDRLKYELLCKDLGIVLIDGKETVVASLKTNKYDFSIVNNSNTYYEAMYYDLLCFRFEPDENEIFMGLDDKFHDAKSLINIIEVFKNMDDLIINKEVEKLLVNTLGMGVNNYKEIIQ